jgi:hypothetical protein
MQQCVLDQQRHLRLLVGEALPVAEQVGQLAGGRWHELRGLDRLAGAQLPGRPLAALRARHQTAVHLAQRSRRVLSGSSPSCSSPHRIAVT